MRNSFFPAIGILSLASALVCSASSSWETDWNKALEKAGKSGQPVLVDFTGSDWCPGCIYLRKNIFDTDEFAKYAADHQFVLLELDFPRTAGKMPPEQLKFHEELMRRYGVSSFPSVLLVEGDGAPYAKIVGGTRTPGEYLKKLEAAGETRRKLKEAVAAALPLKGKEKLDQLVKALNVLPEDLQPFQKNLIAEITVLDPEDRYGFTEKSKRAAAMEKQRFMMEQFFQKYSGRHSAEDLRASRQEALQILEKKDILPPIRLQIAKYISDGYAMERNLPKALEYLKIARDADPESEEAKKLEPWIDNMRKFVNQKK